MKKRFLKAFSLLFVTVMLFGCIHGLAEENSLYSGDPITLKMMVFGQTGNVNQVNEIFFEHFPEIDQKVDIEFVLCENETALAEQLRLMLAAGEELPDLIRLQYYMLPEFAQTGKLMDISESMKPYMDDLIPEALRIMTYNDTMYAYVYEIKPKVWYYRADIFDELGIDPLQIKTTEDFLEAGRIIHEAYPNSYIENISVPNSGADLMMRLSGNGSAFADADGNFNLASDPNVKAAFEDLKKLADSPYIMNLAEGGTEWQAAIVNGSLVSQLSGAWLKQHIIDWAPEQSGKWAAAPWPEEWRAGSESGGGIWVVPVDSPYADIACDFLAKYTCDMGVQEDVYLARGRIPPMNSVLESKVFSEPHPYFGESLVPTTLDVLNTFDVFPYTSTFTSQQKIILQYLDEYMEGNLDVDEALKRAQEDMENQLGNAWQ